MVAYKTMNAGKLFALQFYYDEPFLLATGGDKGLVAVWESDEMVGCFSKLDLTFRL